jgi:hypothetical protein
LPGRDYEQLAGNGQDFCAVTGEGRVQCEGLNWYALAPSLPASRPFVATSWLCALDAAGAISCWNRPYWDKPFEGLPERTGFQKIAGSCALNAQGYARCQGHTPPDVAFSTIRTHNDGGCGVLADTGALLCWGSVGSAGRTQLFEPYGSGYRDVTLGYYTTCVLGQDDHLQCFGSSAYTTVPDGMSSESFATMATGGSYTCAIRKDSAELTCWGAFDIRAAVSAPPEGRFSAVSVSPGHACALRESDSRIVCWGDAQLPEGVTHASYTSVDAFSESTCAIRAEDQKRVCWGRGFLGEGGELVVTP